MALITLIDLPMSSALDCRAMSAIRGCGGAPWVTGAFRPYAVPSVQSVPSIGAVANNFFQIENNFYHIESMVNQYQTIQLTNTGNNSNLTAVAIGAFNG